MTFRSQIQWQLFDLDTYEERLKYRYITDWNHNSRVNRYIRSISGDGEVKIVETTVSALTDSAETVFSYFEYYDICKKVKLCICIWPAGQILKTNRSWCFTYDFLGKLKPWVNKIYWYENWWPRKIVSARARTGDLSRVRRTW